MWDVVTWLVAFFGVIGLLIAGALGFLTYLALSEKHRWEP
jgi:hypothetical protein